MFLFLFVLLLWLFLLLLLYCPCFQGDWITPHGSEDNPMALINILFNNCYLHYITSLASRIAALLDHPKDAAQYRQAATALATNINKAFYNTTTGAYVDQLQTHLLMPLATGVVPVDQHAAVLEGLQRAIAKTGGHLDTGLTGNYFMTKYFTETNRNDLMMGITNKTTFPSYGYFLKQGYTTWPEQWNVEPCCGQVKLSKMHGCYNAVGMWFVQGLVGITVDYSNADGYYVVVRAGVDAGELDWVTGKRATPYGVVESAWSMAPTNGTHTSFEHNVTVPGNGRAKVYIPSATVAGVLEHGRALPGDVQVLGQEVINQVPFVVLGVGAGRFVFSSTWGVGL